MLMILLIVWIGRHCQALLLLLLCCCRCRLIAISTARVILLMSNPVRCSFQLVLVEVGLLGEVGTVEEHVLGQD